MSILSKLSRSKADAVEAQAPRQCEHWEVAPRWDSNEDIGKKYKVTYYTCSTCGESFTPDEIEALRASV